MPLVQSVLKLYRGGEKEREGERGRERERGGGERERLRRKRGLGMSSLQLPSCAVCLGPLDEPVTTPCGHNFCRR